MSGTLFFHQRQGGFFQEYLAAALLLYGTQMLLTFNIFSCQNLLWWVLSILMSLIRMAYKNLCIEGNEIFS